MASYINNIFQNARIQDVQAFTPDWNFLAQGQAQLSATQKKNFSDFAQRYNSIIDGELSREDNVALRDKYKKDAEEFVKQVSGMDLTDPRNVKAAETLFTPLVDNKLYIRDILNTRAVRDSYAKAQQQAVSMNPAERDLYNEDSLKQMNYFLQDFRMASPDQAINMQAPSYLPGINLEKMALNFFNRQQYDVEVEQNTGQWIIKTKGGKLVEGNLRAGLLSEFYGDPLVRQNISLKNQMQKRDFVESNLMTYNGDRLAAEADFYRQKYSGVLSTLEAQGKKVLEEIDAEAEVATSTIQKINSGQNGDNTPMSDGPLSYREELQRRVDQLSGLSQSIKQENNQIIAAGTTKSKATSPYTVTIDGKTYTPEQLDSILFQNEVGNIANRLAMSRFSQTVKENPYAMAQWKSDLDWRNTERKLRLEDELANKPSSILGLADGTFDIANASKEIFENLKDTPSKALEFDQTRLQATAMETMFAENELIKRYMQITGDNRSFINLSPADRLKLIEKAKSDVKAGGLAKDAHELISPLVQNYNALTKVGLELNNIVRDNFRVAIEAASQKGDIFPENKETLLRLLETTTDLKRLEQEFVKFRTGQIAGQRAKENVQAVIGNDPFSKLQVGLRALFGNNPEDQAKKEFETLFGDRETMISKAYYEHASSLDARTAGYNAGVGGITTFGKDLGQATNTGNTISDAALNLAYRSIVGNNIINYYEGNIKSSLGKTPKIDKRIIPVFQTMLDQLNQNQKETAGTLRTANVQVSVDPVTNEQYIYMRPNQALIESVYVSSDKKAGILSKGEAERILTEGITFRLPAGSIPSNVLGVQKLTPTQQLFALTGEVRLGGDMSADKGSIVISKNASGKFDVIGSRYENGKSIPLGTDLETFANDLYLDAMVKRQQGQAIDPDMLVVQQLEQYLNSL
jgi:hypothetical protein